MTEQLTGTAGVLGVVVAMSTATIAVIVVVVVLVLVAAAFIVRAGAIEQTRRDAVARTQEPPTGGAAAPVGRPADTTADPLATEPGGPVRYGVSLTRRDGEPTRYLVVTSAGSKRAASIAFERDGAASDRVQDVRVEALGPVALGPDGTPDMDAGDLFDRSEY